MPLVLMLLFIAGPSINSAHSSLQQEYSIQNMGNILTQDNFAETVFFEYGAELGELQPPWDYVGPHGSGDTSGSYTQISSEHARSGSYSLKMYQVPPPKSDAQRRISNRYYGVNHQKNELYISWWACFDNRWNTQDPNGWGSTLGGWQIFFGPENGPTYYWWTGGRFHILKTSRNVQFGYSWGKLEGGVNFSPDAEVIKQSWDTGDSIQNYLNQWVHFQVYVKIHETSGVVRAWFNNELIAEKAGIATDPRAYAEWDDNPVDHTQCVFRSSEGGPYPRITIELYQGQDSIENWYWVDDVVAAMEKVTESYEVGDK